MTTDPEIDHEQRIKRTLDAVLIQTSESMATEILNIVDKYTAAIAENQDSGCVHFGYVIARRINQRYVTVLCFLWNGNLNMVFKRYVPARDNYIKETVLLPSPI